MKFPRLDFVGLATRGATLLAFALTVLLVVPFEPFVGGLEGEPWRYAMNAAVADHLVFGRDIAFTAGPLSTVYTHAYHPATDTFLIAGSLILAAAFFAGFAAITPARRRAWLLLVPLVISQLPFEGAMLLALPLLLLLTAEMYANGGNRKLLAVVFLLAIACTLLPLIKGTFAVAAVAGAGLAFVALSRRRPTAAIALASICIVTLVGTWLSTGQHLAALPLFFTSQIPVMSGYTVAMALTGNTWEAVVYPLFALGVFIALSGLKPLRRWRVALASALLLFIAFKAGFVRHDTHPIISAGALALAGLIAFVETPTVSRRGVLGLVAGFAGAVVTTMAYHSYDTEQMQLSMFTAVRESAVGLADRLLHPERLPQRFAEENARLRATYPLPHFDGDADIYPENVAALLASGTRWNPRPAVLSYNAYTPSLARLDEAHLHEHAPSRIYFNIGPIDGRYPALDDGLSWPALIGNYRISGFAGPYLILDRAATGHPLHFGEESTTTVAFGQTVDLSARKKLVWAKLLLRPTVLGRIASTLYKLPQLTMSVRYDDGSAREYRIVPGMASEGFLLSPTVTTATEFAALQSRQRNRLLAGKFPISMTITGGRGSRWLWESSYPMTLQDVDIPSSDDADAALLARPAETSGDEANPIAGGECAIDAVNGKPGLSNGITDETGLTVVQGWALPSATEGKLADFVKIALIQDGHTYLATTRVVARPDVGANFKHPEAINTGFEALIDTRAMHGSFDIRVVQKAGDRVLLCGANSHVTIP